MEPEATKLMAETLAVNAIDKSEYPQMTEVENRCVNIIADIWNAPEGQAMGTSTVGSSGSVYARRDGNEIPLA